MRPFASACLALASVAAAGVVAVAARPQYGGTLRVETDAIVRTMDPAAPLTDAGEIAARAHLSSLVFEPLTAVDEGGLRPRLATSWEREGGGRRWRFHLKTDIPLHDGTTLQAWQVAASLRASEPSWKIAAEGETVAIEAEGAIADLPWALADDRHAIVVRGRGGAMIGSGPFKLDRREGGRVALRAHDPYWRARPFVDAVEIASGRAFDAQLTDLEAGRADFIGVRAVDVQRATRRGVRVDASKPLELVALIFESHRASDSTRAWRQTIASTLNRDAICAVVLQGRATPARSVLPAWLSGYAAFVAPPQPAALTHAAVAALPLDLRQIALRVDAGDAVSQAIADRIAVDAREAGFRVTVQTPVGLAPRADARLVRVRLPPTSPDRAFAQAASRLTIRGWPPLVAPDDGTLQSTWAAETALVADTIVVPVVHLPELYALGERVGFSPQPAVHPLGGWNLADVWVRGKP